MSSEKDRFGDKLRDKEHGDEERYFAQQEREKIEKLRALSAQAASTLGSCPRDGAQLTERDHLGVRIGQCPTCDGMWLAKGQLEQICQKDEGWAHRWLRSVLSGSQR